MARRFRPSAGLSLRLRTTKLLRTANAVLQEAGADAALALLRSVEQTTARKLS
jgi:hypothetical protein